ncbi:MAG: cardiolipin synthase [Coriobacteriia bacterium]|nr:cardiolipin synthase [Coriobacteriia bacterium]
MWNPSPAEIVYLIAILVIVLLILDEERDTGTTLAWLIILIVLPGLGLVLYFFWGRNWRRIRRYNQLVAETNALADAALGPTYEMYEHEAEELIERVRDGYIDRLIGVISAQNATRPIPAVEVEVITSGAQKFDSLKIDLAAAQSFVHLQYYIWERDELTAEITAILLDRLAAGVEVRIMYDFIGSMFYSNAEFEQLKRAGAHVIADLRSLSKLNYRNHYKIAVIDGRVGYTGGMNMGAEYIDGGRRFDAWRDTHLRVTGPFVAELQRLFAGRWYEARRESLFDLRYFPPPGQGACGPMLHLAHSSIDTHWESIRHAYLLAITKAEETVRIQSPYLVPDASTYDALIVSALSGVDVRLMMTGVPDKRLPFWAAHSFMPRLLEAGVRIYQYDAGFFHAKALAIDSKVCAIGTTNIDVRSFSLHNELAVFIYDAAMTRAAEQTFEADMAFCHEVTPEHLAAIGSLERFRNSAARLWGKLL